MRNTNTDSSLLTSGPLSRGHRLSAEAARLLATRPALSPAPLTNHVPARANQDYLRSEGALAEVLSRGVYGLAFSSRTQVMGIHEVKTAPRSPWQNPYVERLIGTLRRECLDHFVVFNATHRRRLLRDYLIYYHSARTHLSLDKDAPEPRAVERLDQGRIVETPLVGGLHHRYSRWAA